MDKLTFKSLKRQSRISKRGFEVRHNGERYWISGQYCDRLAWDGTFNRVPGAAIALALSHAAHARTKLELPRACYGLIGIARELRESL